jgi:hypothetical protein
MISVCAPSANMLVFNPNELVLAKQAGAELLMMKRRKLITLLGDAAVALAYLA